MTQNFKIMNNRITPYNITELKTNEIFVFGSNSNGVHNGNAAATAMKFGAIMGQAVGIQGQTYACLLYTSGLFLINYSYSWFKSFW